MKVLLAVCFTLAAIFLVACRKHDDCPEPPKPDAACDLMQSIITGYTDMPANTSQFRKEYDQATGKVRKVVAGIYSLYLADSVALLLTYNGNEVYFTSAQQPSDTVLIATFNSERLVKIIWGNTTNVALQQWYEPITEFYYAAGKLSSITRYTTPETSFNYYTTYDQNGNLIRVHELSDDANAGTFFTYDLSVKATAQFYSDHNGTDFGNNSIYLAHFLGWLPDLNPANKRTSFRHVFSDEDTTDSEPGYTFNQTDLSDHVYDSEGKLLSYKIADAQITFINNWHCTEAKLPN